MGLMVSLDLTGRQVLVIGGGRIAYHKTIKLMENGAQVTVIAPTVVESFLGLDCIVQRRAYRQGDETGFFMVICATDDAALNRQIYEDCNRAGILCVSVSNPSHCSMSATAEKGGISVSVSTVGQNPGFAKHLCEQFVGAIDGELLGRFNAHTKLRKAVMDDRVGTQDKQGLLRRALHMSAEDIEGIMERGSE